MSIDLKLDFQRVDGFDMQPFAPVAGEFAAKLDGLSIDKGLDYNPDAPGAHIT